MPPRQLARLLGLWAVLLIMQGPAGVTAQANPPLTGAGYSCPMQPAGTINRTIIGSSTACKVQCRPLTATVKLPHCACGVLLLHPNPALQCCARAAAPQPRPTAVVTGRFIRFSLVQATTSRGLSTASAMTCRAMCMHGGATLLTHPARCLWSVVALPACMLPTS